MEVQNRFTMRGETYSAHSMRTFRSGLQHFLTFLAESSHAEPTEPYHFTEWLKHRNMRPATVRRHSLTAQKLLYILCGPQVTSPASSFPARQGSAIQTLPYTLSEVDRLLQFADPEERVIVLLALDAGLTVGEIVSIQRQNVADFLDQMTIPPVLTLLGRHDTNEQRVGVALSGRLVEALGVWLSKPTQTLTSLLAGSSQAYANARFRSLCSRVELPCKGLRGLRVTGGALVYRETRNIDEVLKFLRLKSRQQADAYAYAASLLEPEELNSNSVQ